MEHTENRTYGKSTSKESLLKLSEYASSSKINILVENHGGYIV